MDGVNPLLLERSETKWPRELTAGVAAAMALVPEVVTYSLLAGISPLAGLLSTGCIAILFGLAGGRPGLISGTTAAMAFIMAHLVAHHGLAYLAAATVLAGAIQLLLGLTRAGRIVNYIPRPVVSGFRNALAILLLMTVFPYLSRSSWPELALTATALLIIYGLPRLVRSAFAPPPLIALAALTLAAVWFKDSGIATVAEAGAGATMMPAVAYLDTAALWTRDSLAILLPYAVSLALVGLMETLVTAKVVEEETNTRNRSDRMVRGQGIANLAAGLLAGAGGGGHMSPTAVNLKQGGRGGMSSVIAGAAIAALVLGAGDAIGRIPLAALSGILIAVALEMFDWKSLKQLSRTPGSEVIIMIVTTFMIAATHDLTFGIAVGVVLSFLIIGWRLGRMHMMTELNERGAKVYVVSGPLFFGTASAFLERFDTASDPGQVVIDVRHSHIWDQSAATAVSRVLNAYSHAGKSVELVGLDDDSRRLMRRAGLAPAVGEAERLPVSRVPG